jgi:hypothetical protein
MIPALWVNKHIYRRWIIILLNKISSNYIEITKILKIPRESPKTFWNYDLSPVLLLCEFIICTCELWISNVKSLHEIFPMPYGMLQFEIILLCFLSFNVHESNLPIWLLFILLGYNLTLRFPNGKYELFVLHLHLETFPMI